MLIKKFENLLVIKYKPQIEVLRLQSYVKMYYELIARLKK